MNKKIILFFAILFSLKANTQNILYAIRVNTDNTKDSFFVKFTTDSVFNKQGTFIARTVEYYNQFFQPVYPNGFDKFFKGADGIWRNTMLPDADITGTTGINQSTQSALDTKAGTNAPTFTGLMNVNNLLAEGGIGSTGTAGVGYYTGAGGTVTQTGNKGNAVTLNKICGQITTASAALAAGAEVSFTLNNSTIVSTDVVFVNMSSGGTAGSYLFSVGSVTNGACTITISNASTGSLSQALVLNFVVIKGVAN